MTYLLFPKLHLWKYNLINETSSSSRGSVCRILKSNLVLTRDCGGSIGRVLQSNLVVARDFCGSMCKVLESNLVLARDCRGYVCKVLESTFVLASDCACVPWQSWTIVEGRMLWQQGQSKDWAQLVCMVYKRGNFTKWQSLALEVIKFLGCLDISAK